MSNKTPKTDEITTDFIISKADELKAAIVRESQEEEADIRQQILEARERRIARVDDLVTSKDYNKLFAFMVKHGVIELEKDNE